jgi:hypothetical protein
VKPAMSMSSTVVRYDVQAVDEGACTFYVEIDPDSDEQLFPIVSGSVDR